MLQDIAPDTYHNEFAFHEARPEDKLVIYRGRTVLAWVNEGVIRAPLFEDFDLRGSDDHFPFIYLFSVSDERYFMIDLPESLIDRLLTEPGWEFIPLRTLVDYAPKRVRFALTVGFEYWNWYSTAQYCGRCGAKTQHDVIERMMRCPECGLTIFPKISPAVIVAITRPDGKVLVTRYADRPNANYALVAGYCEMGETVEQTVHREVNEEVGLRVKNLRYYKSQPWPDSSSLLCGFFCELDGSPEIVLDKHELSVAEWVDRDQLLLDNDHSLTRDMMGVLRDHRENDYSVIPG
jgi:NAD+ diphosphatase